MSNRIPRRNFLKTATVASAGLSIGVWSSRAPGSAEISKRKAEYRRRRHQRHGRGRPEGAFGENIVALCNVNENSLAKAAGRYTKAKKHIDFRRMLENDDKSFDAVLVSTPDHIHAPASVMAMSLGKHCYCQKPLAHEVYEVRVMAKIAAEKKLATQMGTQMHGTEQLPPRGRDHPGGHDRAGERGGRVVRQGMGRRKAPDRRL